MVSYDEHHSSFLMQGRPCQATLLFLGGWNHRDFIHKMRINYIFLNCKESVNFGWNHGDFIHKMKNQLYFFFFNRKESVTSQLKSMKSLPERRQDLATLWACVLSDLLIVTNNARMKALLLSLIF